MRINAPLTNRQNLWGVVTGLATPQPLTPLLPDPPASANGEQQASIGDTQQASPGAFAGSFVCLLEYPIFFHSW